MKLTMLVALLMLVTNVSRADDAGSGSGSGSAAADPAVFHGFWLYAGSDGSPAPQHMNPKAACKDWEAARKKSGQKFELTGVKRGTSTSNPDHMCKYLDKNGKTPKNDITGPVVNGYYRCPIGSRSFTLGNSGLIKDHRCRCDDPKGTCKSESPPAPENSPRCTQQPARKVTKAEAEKASADNAKKARAADKQFTKDYDAIRDERINDTCTFKKSDFYPDAPSDVNIGYLCGKYEQDFAAANNMAGLASTPPGWVWHHHEDMGRMQLISKQAHDGCKHTGGVGIWAETLGMPNSSAYPMDLRLRLPAKPIKLPAKP